MNAAALRKHLPATILVAGIALQAGCAGFRTCPDSWWGADKLGHFAAAAMIGAGGAALASSRLDAEEAAAAGWSAALLAGVSKEGWDLNVKHTCWSWHDLFWDFLGASAGASAAWAVE